MPGEVERHARSDIQYVDGLARHIADGGEASAKNVSDLIAMVRWNAENLIRHEIVDAALTQQENRNAE